MQTRSDVIAGLRMPVWAIAIVVLGMVMIILGVIHGGLFLPGVWVLIVGFIGLIGSAVYELATERTPERAPRANREP